MRGRSCWIRSGGRRACFVAGQLSGLALGWVISESDGLGPLGPRRRCERSDVSPICDSWQISSSGRTRLSARSAPAPGSAASAQSGGDILTGNNGGSPASRLVWPQPEQRLHADSRSSSPIAGISHPQQPAARSLQPLALPEARSPQSGVATCEHSPPVSIRHPSPVAVATASPDRQNPSRAFHPARARFNGLHLHTGRRGASDKLECESPRLCRVGRAISWWAERGMSGGGGDVEAEAEVAGG
jgi:hypothetical protein